MKKLFLLLSAAVLSIGFFTSCNYENPRDYETVLMPHLVKLYTHNDTTFDGVKLDSTLLIFHCADTTATEGVHEMQFIGIGKNKTVNNITTIPATGWVNDTLAVAANHGYLVRYHKYGTDAWLYRRFFIREYILLGGEDWYCRLQYDKRDWNPLTAR